MKQLITILLFIFSFATSYAQVKTVKVTGSGSVSADSSVFSTNFRIDTAKVNIYTLISGLGGGSGLNIYNSDSTLSGDRTIEGGNHYLFIDNLSSFEADAYDLGGNTSTILISGGNQNAMVTNDFTRAYSTNLVVGNDIVSINSNHSDSAIKFVIQSIDSLNVVSPTRIAVWDNDTLKSALASSIGGGGIDTTAWSRSGNTVYSGADKLGPTNDATLRFITRDTVRAYIDSATGNFVSRNDVWADSGNIKLQNVSGTRSLDALNNFSFTLNGSTANSISIGSGFTTINNSGTIELNPDGTNGAHPFVFNAPAADRATLTLGHYNTGAVRKYGIIQGYTFAGSTYGTDIVIYGGTETVSGDVGNVILAHDLTNPYGKVGIGTPTPATSSILDVSSTTKGALLPRMTAAQRIAISSPATALVVFDTDSASYFFYSGSAWVNMTSTGGGGSGLTASNFVFNETPSGTINSSNVTFTLANTPTALTVQVYKNGQRMKLTTHYSISGDTITFVTAPSTGDDLIVDYLK